MAGALPRPHPTRGGAGRRFLSITDCQAEPTGIYVSRSGRLAQMDLKVAGQ